MVASRQTALTGVDFETWLATLPLLWPPEQVETLRRAYQLGGTPELAVADLLADLGADYEVVATAFLHGPVAAGQLSVTEVQDAFGAGVAGLVADLVRLEAMGGLHQDGQAASQLERLRRLLLAMAQDVRVVLLQLALRLQMLRRLSTVPLPERQRIARETLDLFTPLANRLGIGQLKWEMEDLALRVLEPEAYQRIAIALEERRADRERYIARLMEELRASLRQSGICAQVSGRVKHIYSIWRKMQRKRLTFDQVFDVRALRVQVESVTDCYAALGAIHAHWNPVAREFDDYIAHPKSNGYQSLHTAVIGPEGRVVEVQIRTAAMHQHAELGVAAHWCYKEGGTGPGGSDTERLAWLRQMLESRIGGPDEPDDADLLERFKNEAFQDRVYAITPKGAILELPRGATPLDFAYHVHTEVGHRCRGAKVNGRIVPLTYPLKTGEQVEVLTARTGHPSRDWLSPHLGYVRTLRARAKIRQWFLQQDQEQSVVAGRATLEREFQRLGIRQLKLEKVAEKLGFNRLDDLCAALGHGTVTLAHVIGRIQDLLPAAMPSPEPPAVRSSRTAAQAGRGPQGVQVRGVGQLLSHLAQCCQPTPPEPIAGYITQGRGVTIHRQDCANFLGLARHHRERVIEVGWGETPATYPVDILIVAHDRPGLLRDITAILANEQVNVLRADTLTGRDSVIARMGLTVEVTSIIQLSRVLDHIGQLTNVIEAYRRH